VTLIERLKLLLISVKISPQISAITFFLIVAVTSSTASGIGRVSHSWSDINTRNVIRWEGDTAVVSRESYAKDLTCRFYIDLRKVVGAIEDYGIPSQWTLISYRNQQELAIKQLELQVRAATHGIKVMEDNRFIVDYTWVIDRSVNDLRDVARSIRSTAIASGYRSRRELIGAFTSFVQSLEYRIPPNHRVDDDGEKILTAGVMMPLETLTKGWGDCDSKGLLFATLIRCVDLVDVCFIVIDNHLFVGVQTPPNQGDHVIRHNRRDWVLVELCDAWQIGRIPMDHYNDITHGNYEVVDLD